MVELHSRPSLTETLRVINALIWAVKREIIVPLLLSIVASACGSQTATPAATTSKPSGTSAVVSTSAGSGQGQTAPLAVMVSGLDTFPRPPIYTVSLVDLSGKVVRAATAANRSWSEIHFSNDGYGHPVSLPQVSASNNRLYYLDGEATVRYLAPDGASGVAHTLPVGPLSHAVFAVSPDDQRIAVTLVNYPSVSTGSIEMSLYVEDLSGGGNRVDLFDSTSVLEWPVGWHAGQLVIAVAPAPYGQNPCDICAYRSPAEYHVADPATGKRTATLCPVASGGSSIALPSRGGIECEVRGNTASHQSLLESWDGATHSVPSDLCGIGGPVSPDGQETSTLWAPQLPDGGCTHAATITLIDHSGKRTATAVPGTPQEWIDSQHLGFQTPEDKWAILDLSSSGTMVIDAPGALVGVLPGNLG